MTGYLDRPKFLLKQMEKLLGARDRQRDLKKAATIPGFASLEQRTRKSVALKKSAGLKKAGKRAAAAVAAARRATT